MLVVISDLHFEEEDQDRILNPAGVVALPFFRNLPPSAYWKIIARLADEVERNDVKRLEVVLAGDIFDLHRTLLWFGKREGHDDKPDPKPQRPYVTNKKVTADLEQKVLDILDAIEAEPNVQGALEAFRLLWNGRCIREVDGKPTEVDFAKTPIEIQGVYLPGNHDRLANATPAIRMRVRKLLGLPESEEPFLHTYGGTDPRVLVRHGHEYDSTNFGTDCDHGRPIRETIADRHYDAPTFGDFVTIDIVGALPWKMRQFYGHDRILKNKTLAAIYRRLLEFDDVRPQTRLLDFVLDLPKSRPTPEKAWTLLEPVVCALLEDIHKDRFLHRCLDRMRPADLETRAILTAVKAALATHIWRLGLPLETVRSLLPRIEGGGDGPSAYATREEVVTKGKVRFVVAGHTHAPDIVPIGKAAREQVFVDTGTWRNRLLPTTTGQGFVRLKSLTYLIVYGSTEDGGGKTGGTVKQESFDFWSGFAEKWPKH